MLLLSSYINSDIIRRTSYYVLLVIIFFSLIEAIERVFSIPYSQGLLDSLYVWVLSFPYYVAVFLPACFFASIFYCFINWVNTYQYCIFLYSGMPSWRWKIAIFTHGLFIFGLMLFINGFLVTWSMQGQYDKLQEGLSKQKLPNMVYNKFNRLKLGSRQMLIYPNRKGDKESEIFVIDKKTNKGVELLMLKSIAPLVDDQKTGISFYDGTVYNFLEGVINNIVHFNRLDLPLDIDKKLGNSLLSQEKSSIELFQIADKNAYEILSWRIHSAAMVIVLCVCALVILDYSVCRNIPKVLIFEAACLYLLYFFIIVYAKTQSVNVSFFNFQIYYISAHVMALLTAFIFKYVLNSRLY